MNEFNKKLVVRILLMVAKLFADQDTKKKGNRTNKYAHLCLVQR